jgi:signal transduction histidine kinase
MSSKSSHHGPLDSGESSYEQRRKLGESVQQLLKLHEQERQSIACDIHDGFIQDVVGAQMVLESLMARLSNADAEDLAALQRVGALLAGAVADARRLISGLRVPLLEEVGLCEALGQWCEQHDAVSVFCTCELDESHLSSVLQVAVFRIVQEAIRNVHRHAACDEAQVHISQQASSLVIEVEDQGVGFDVTAVSDSCFGLDGLRQRARMLGGEAKIESQPGGGTRIRVTLPISA